MTDYSLAVSPLLPVAVLVALAAAGIFIVALGLILRQRAVWLRALGLALIIFALFDPSLERQDRTPLKQVVAIVVDRSGSQTIGDRTAQTDKALAILEARLKALGNTDVRVIEGGANDGGNNGTQLFAALNAGLADVPAEQIAGVFMITDGVVHDIPAKADALGFKAPLHAFITGHEGERDRRIELVEAPRFGIVGKDQTIALKVLDTDNHGEPVRLDVRRDGNKIATVPGDRGRNPFGFRSRSSTADRTSSNSKSRRSPANSPPSTTRPWWRSTACATSSRCSSSRGNPTRASGCGATCSSPTPTSISCISPSCARRRSRTARRSTNCP